jgi:hypothetical protein
MLRVDGKSFGRLLGAVLQDLRARHSFAWPFTGVVIDRDCNLQSLRFSADEFRVLAAAGSLNLGFPLTWLFADASGKIARTTVTAARAGRGYARVQCCPPVNELLATAFTLSTRDAARIPERIERLIAAQRLAFPLRALLLTTEGDVVVVRLESAMDSGTPQTCYTPSGGEPRAASIVLLDARDRAARVTVASEYVQ